jgi:pimeloyl-ACP methyl ester carboxylesterase
LVSTRAVGAACDGAQLERALVCERLVQRDGRVAWEQTDWRATLGSARPTIVYVHGNRVEEGKDRQQGLEVYRALKAQADLSGPVRLVIWSWPSTKLRRPVKDYVVKAHLTHPAAWQLAWWIDRLPLETPVALVGYSYGTRVVTGATQLLAGGTLGSLALPERHHPERPPVRAALIAAAFDADWIEPGAFYGRSVAKLERLVLATNRLDPAMRFYHLSNGRRRIDALGKQGVEPSPSLGELVSRMRQLDFTPEVGRSHALSDYLQAHAQMQALWKAVLPEGERVARKSR